MKGKFIKLITVMVSTVMVTSIFAGCNSKKTTETKSDGVAGAITYPVKNGGKLTYWLQLDPKVSDTSKTIADTEFAKELTKETGIQIEWIHPTQGQEQQSLNLLIASGSLPDIIEGLWGSWYSGGPEKAIQDNVILKVNDLVDKYAPNYQKVLKSDSEKNKQVRTDSGALFGFSCFRGDDLTTVYYGPILRGDWLKDLNLSVPTTVSEFETVLQAFKDKKGATAPLTAAKSLDPNFIAGAYGFSTGWYINDNKKVAYGPLASKYKDYLTLMNKWYKAGLLDKNYASNDGNAVKANMLNGKSGVTLGFIGGNMGTWINAMKGKDSKYDLVASQYPTLNKGEKVKFAQKDFKYNGWTAAISTSCKNPELAARLLDYGYSEKGEMLYNFGIEGTSYKMVNGYPTYTDTIMKNPNNLSIGDAMAQYQRACYADGPFIQRKEYVQQFLALPEQQDALKILTKADPTPNQYPPATTNSQESQELASIEGDINTYVSEMTVKFILGTEPLSNYDSFVTKLKSMKIDRAIQIRQAAVDRYNKRS